MKTLTFITALLFAPVAFAQGAPPTETPPQDVEAPKADVGTEKPKDKPVKLSENELQIMAHYKALNEMEIDLGKVAQKRGASQAVKAYGKMLVTDHEASNKQLMEIAKLHDQKIPSFKPVTEAERKSYQDAKANAAKIKKMKGQMFDREFLRMMVMDHERELANIDANIGKVQNTQIVEAIRDLEPVLQRHADQARELQKSEAQAMR